MNSDIQLRVARSEDIVTLLGFVEAYYALDGIQFRAAVAEAAVTTLLRTSSLGRIWLITEREVPIGYVVLCFGYSIEAGGRDAWLDELYLTAPQRGKGIGTWVLGQVIEHARELGVLAMQLEVGRRNVRAHRCYASLGFRAREQFHLMDIELA